MTTPRTPTAPEPMPDSTRRGLIGGAVLLVLVAAWINISHTRQNATDHGADAQTALVVGLIPDVMLVLSVLRLRYHRRSPWAWCGVAGAVALVSWSALATSSAGVGAKVIAMVCVTAAIIATGQAHVPHGEPHWLIVAHLEALVDDAVRGARVAAEHARAETGARIIGMEAAARDAFDAEMQAARAAHAAELEQVRAELTARIGCVEENRAVAVRDAQHSARISLETEAERDRERERARVLEVELATARATLAAQRTEPARGARKARAQPRTDQRTEPARSLAEASVRADDLALRRHVRAQWERRTAAGRKTPTRALARTLGISDGGARAQVSRWTAERAVPDGVAGDGRTEVARS